MVKRLWIPRLPLRYAQGFGSGLIFGLLCLGLAACGGVATQDSESEAAEPMPTRASLRDLGPAPELTNDIWLNVEAPLRLADLHGKVVAIDMWTFG